MEGRTVNPQASLSRSSWPVRLAAGSTFLVTFGVLAALIPAQALTDDDDYYAPAGIRYMQWVRNILHSSVDAFSSDAVSAAFQLNHEHPPLAKYVFGASHLLFHEVLGVATALDGARLGTALLSATTAAVLVGLLWTPLGVTAALAAPILLMSLPRFFFHSQVATLDVPVACAVLVVTATYFAAEESGSTRRAVLCGVAFGGALLVKLNAPFALIPCFVLAALGRWRGFAVRDAQVWIPPVPRSLVWMVLVGPVLFISLWPWLWFDTAQRLSAYVAFHLRHYPIYMFYDGEIWEHPFAPWHATFIHALGAMPASIVVLAAFGSLRGVSALVRIVRGANATGDAPRITKSDKLRALILLQAVFAIGVVATPATPRYGGEKLFMPFFPLVCALAADGLLVVVGAVSAFFPRLHHRLIGPLVIGLAALPGFWATATHHGGFALSYYGELLGGLRGAVARGHERTYYDVTDKELARFLESQAAGLSVHFEPNHKEYVRTYRWLAADGVIQGVKLVRSRDDADIIVLTHERRWATYPQLLDELRTWGDIVHERAVDGVPLYTVYRRR